VQGELAKKYERQDTLYKRAKDQGFRSRAAYKLEELDTKYKIFAPGQSVIDLGAWPGGWLQVALNRIGSKGRIVGVDLTPLDGFEGENVQLLCGDVADDLILEQAQTFCGGELDVVMSDMSPKLTGIPEADRMGVLSCAEKAFYVAERLLKDGGTLIIKIFKGSEIEEFVKNIRPSFNKVARTTLKASRGSSSESYLVGLGFIRSRDRD